MEKYAITPPKPISLAIKNTDERFAVRRIYCVGRNYANHVKEMGGDPRTSPPIFFTKSRETIVSSGAKIPYPSQTKNLHYEVELVVAMKGKTDIFGYAVGLDMTRRDLQKTAKAGGKPWDMAKNFENSAPCGMLIKAQEIDLTKASISLKNNGITKQKSKLSKMIWHVEEIIEHLNKLIPLKAGDLIFTGTPEGVGPVKTGDVLTAQIDGLPELEIQYV